MWTASSSFNNIAFLLVFVSCLLQKAEGGMSKQCKYSGYEPGGAINAISGSIKKIEPAKFETTVLQTALDYFNDGSGVSAATLGVIDAAGDVLKAAPQLTAAIGVVTVGLGFLNDKPSAQDVLDKAIESVNLLREEVNGMLDQMKDYVDAKDLQSEKNSMDNIYKERFEYWINCAKELTTERANLCQERAVQRIRSARFHFQLLQEKFEMKHEGKQAYNPNFDYRASTGTWQWMDKNCGLEKHAGAECLSHEDVKRLEVGIIPFRDYVMLHLLALKTLEATYKKNSKTDKLACGDYKKYLKETRDKAAMYADYARWAYEWDYIRQYEENEYFGVAGRPGGPASQFRGGYLGTRECDGSNKCTMECTQMLADKKCTVTGSGASDAVFKACENYNQEVKRQLKEFWDNHVLGVVEVWEKYRDDAAAKLSQEKCDAGQYGKRGQRYPWFKYSN